MSGLEGGAKLKARPLFIAKTVIFSILLFLLWFWVSRVYASLLSESASLLRAFFGADLIEIETETFSYFIIPALSLILASSAGLKRKMKYSLITFFLLFVFDTLGLVSGISDLGMGGGNFGENLTSSVAVVIYNSFAWAYPVFIVLAFSGGRPSMLWQPRVKPNKTNRCPICGQAKTGLIDHIRSVHGEKSLKSWRVKRVLG